MSQESKVDNYYYNILYTEIGHEMEYPQNLGLVLSGDKQKADFQFFIHILQIYRALEMVSDRGMGSQASF